MNVDAREWCIREDITTFINHATIQNAQIAHCEEGRAPKQEWAVGKGPRALTHLNDPYVRHRGHSVEHRGGISFALLSWHTFNSKPGRRHPVSLVRFGVFSFEVSSRARSFVLTQSPFVKTVWMNLRIVRMSLGPDRALPSLACPLLLSYMGW